MLNRNLMAEEMQPLSDLVEPMVWVYAEDVYRFVPSYTWDRYSQVFHYFWTASAFKVTTIIFFSKCLNVISNLQYFPGRSWRNIGSS